MKTIKPLAFLTVFALVAGCSTAPLVTRGAGFAQWTTINASGLTLIGVYR